MPEQIHVLSLNIRMDPDSGRPVPIPPQGAIPPQKNRGWFPDVYAERPWAERRSRLVDAILGSGPLDIIGFQEVLYGQLLDLKELLGQKYEYVSVGRDDGENAGEAVSIFYDKAKFKFVRSKTIWLSPTPEEPGSKGWDAALPRIATLLTLSIEEGDRPGRLVHVVNTHFDHLGVKARAESSLIIREHAKRYVEKFEDPEDPTHPDPAPVILLGDFNSPDREDGYKNITSYTPLPSGARSFTFLDSFHNLAARGTSTKHKDTITRQSRPYGPLKTYTDFRKPGYNKTERIDFVMLASSREASEDADAKAEDAGPRGGREIMSYACIDNWVEEGDIDQWTGRWSDHRAVRVTIAK